MAIDLKAWRNQGLAADTAVAAFDGLAAVGPDALLGDWTGSGLPTGHPLDGLLERYGWAGKRFRGSDAVDPLMFGTSGRVRPLNPGVLPAGLLVRWPGVLRSRALSVAGRAVLPLLATRQPGARLRELRHRGCVSAAMIYDALPIIDHFRAVGPDTLVGWMDLKGMSAPFFFRLDRRPVPF